MKLRCWLRLHNWNNWSVTPLSQDGGQRWFAGQARQCADCWLLQIHPFDKTTAIDFRPLRQAVRDHLTVLANLNGETPESLQSETAKLRKALNKDEGAVLWL